MAADRTEAKLRVNGGRELLVYFFRVDSAGRLGVDGKVMNLCNAVNQLNNRELLPDVKCSVIHDDVNSCVSARQWQRTHFLFCKKVVDCTFSNASCSLINIMCNKHGVSVFLDRDNVSSGDD